MSNMTSALFLLGIGGVLIFIGLPDKAGNSPRFLRFSSAPVIYTPIVLAFLAVGASMLISSAIGN